MTKIVKKLAGLTLGLSLIFGFGVAISSNKQSKNAENVEAIGNYSTNASTYYNDIDATSGQELAAQLHDLITSTHRYYTSYADNGANGYQKNTDQYYNSSGNKVSGKIFEFYSGVEWPNAWSATAGSTTGGYNREHCWCQSNSNDLWGESGGGADMHHLRPVEVRLNSTRSNNLYGEISNRDSNKVYAKYGSNATYALGGYNSGGVFEPLDSKKGDVARIILYVYLHYNSYRISSLFGSYGTTNGNGSSSYFASSLLPLTNTVKASSESAAIALLLKWNAADPVDLGEQKRNEQVAVYQGNRNPFIDNSNYANMIWGSNSDPTVNYVSVSPSSLSLDLNGTTTGTITPTVNVSNGAATTVTWSSSNTNVATVSNSGVVTAVAKGSCTITATSTADSTKSASCSVSISDSSSSGGTPTSTEASVTISSYASTNSWVNETQYGSVTVDGNILATASGGGNTGKYYSSGNQWRLYQTESATLTISASNGYVINSVTITYNSTNGGILEYDSTTVTSGTAVTNINSSSAEFTVVNSGTATNGQARITAISVTYGLAPATLSSISLNTSNVETEFYVNETFDYSGLVVTAHYSDGTEDIVTPTNVTGPSMSSAGTKDVTVSYTEDGVTKTATYQISIIVNSITGIEVDDPKTDYIVGNSFVTPTVYAIYTNGDEVDVTSNASFTGYNLSTSGNQTVTVSYTNGSTFTTSYSITVSAATSPSIELDHYSLSGYTGQSLSLTATYSNLTSDFAWSTAGDADISSTTSSTGTSRTGTSTYTFTMVGEGSKTLIAQGGGATSQQCSLTVIQTTVSLNKSSTSIPVGNTETLTATANVGSVTWTSSNTSAATVSNGVVSVPSNATVGATSTITATSSVDSNVSATCTITVADAEQTLTDVITLSTTGITATAYASGNFSEKSATNTGHSSAVYAGQVIKSTNSAIQMRATSPSGIVTTTSGGKVRGVTITWETTQMASNARILDVYCKTSVYSDSSDLYSNSNTTKGTKVGSISYTNASSYETHLDINGDYTYIGLRSNSSALQISQIEIEWAAATLSSVTTSGQTTSFAVGSKFSYDGTLTAHYTGGKADAVVTPTSFKFGNAGINPTTSGTTITTNTTMNASTHNGKYIYVIYTENSITKYTSYQISVNSNPTLTWTAPTINVYSGSTLISSDTNSWGVSYNNGSGSTTYPSYGQFTIKLAGSTISLPYSWKPEDDGKSLSVTYNSLTTNTTTVSVTQSLQSIVAPTTSTWDYTFASKIWSDEDTQTINSKSWTMSGTDDGSPYYGYDGVKGQQFGSSTHPWSDISLESSGFSGTIDSVTVYTSGAKDIDATIQVSVGGIAYGSTKSLTETNTPYTFNLGGKTGNIKIDWVNNSSKAIYVKEIIVNTVSGSGNIANATGHESAQGAVVKFAKAFNAAMDTTSMCTTNLSSAWSTASSAWSTFLSEAAALGSTEEAYAKSLIRNATAQWTAGTDSDYSYCLERCLATYERCVKEHGQTAFMDEVRHIEASRKVSPISLLNDKNKNTVAIITVISLISITSIGGYFFIRKRKEV